MRVVHEGSTREEVGVNYYSFKVGTVNCTFQLVKYHTPDSPPASNK